MKLSWACAVLALPVVLASCAEAPLQAIVDGHKQERIAEAYADKPLVYGSGDGVGLYSATSAHAPLTMSSTGTADAASH